MLIDGTYEILYIKRSVDSDYYPIACLTDQSFSESSDTIETTTRDNQGWKTMKPTNQEYTISFSGLEDYQTTNKTSFTELLISKKSRELVQWKIGEAGYYQGNAYITELTKDFPTDDYVTFNGTLVGYGNYTNIAESYINRVEADGGTIDNEKCLINYINSLL